MKFIELLQNGLVKDEVKEGSEIYTRTVNLDIHDNEQALYIQMMVEPKNDQKYKAFFDGITLALKRRYKLQDNHIISEINKNYVKITAEGLELLHNSNDLDKQVIARVIVLVSLYSNDPNHVIMSFAKLCDGNLIREHVTGNPSDHHQYYINPDLFNQESSELHKLFSAGLVCALSKFLNIKINDMETKFEKINGKDVTVVTVSNVDYERLPAAIKLALFSVLPSAKAVAQESPLKTTVPASVPATPPTAAAVKGVGVKEDKKEEKNWFSRAVDAVGDVLSPSKTPAAASDKTSPPTALASLVPPSPTAHANAATEGDSKVINGGHLPEIPGFIDPAITANSLTTATNGSNSAVKPATASLPVATTVEPPAAVASAEEKKEDKKDTQKIAGETHTALVVASPAATPAASATPLSAAPAVAEPAPVVEPVPAAASSDKKQDEEKKAEGPVDAASVAAPIAPAAAAPALAAASSGENKEEKIAEKPVDAAPAALEAPAISAAPVAAELPKMVASAEKKEDDKKIEKPLDTIPAAPAVAEPAPVVEPVPAAASSDKKQDEEKKAEGPVDAASVAAPIAPAAAAPALAAASSGENKEEKIAEKPVDAAPAAPAVAEPAPAVEPVPAAASSDKKQDEEKKAEGPVDAASVAAAIAPAAAAPAPAAASSGEKKDDKKVEKPLDAIPAAPAAAPIPAAVVTEPTLVAAPPAPAVSSSGTSTAPMPAVLEKAAKPSAAVVSPAPAQAMSSTSSPSAPVAVKPAAPAVSPAPATAPALSAASSSPSSAAATAITKQSPPKAAPQRPKSALPATATPPASQSPGAKPAAAARTIAEPTVSSILSGKASASTTSAALAAPAPTSSAASSSPSSAPAAALPQRPKQPLPSKPAAASASLRRSTGDLTPKNDSSIAQQGQGAPTFFAPAAAQAVSPAQRPVAAALKSPFKPAKNVTLEAQEFARKAQENIETVIDSTTAINHINDRLLQYREQPYSIKEAIRDYVLDLFNRVKNGRPSEGLNTVTAELCALFNHINKAENKAKINIKNNPLWDSFWRNPNTKTWITLVEWLRFEATQQLFHDAANAHPHNSAEQAVFLRRFRGNALFAEHTSNVSLATIGDTKAVKEIDKKINALEQAQVKGHARRHSTGGV